MKYAIAYLPSALEDLKEIVRYIAHTLQNPKAAERLGLEIIKKTDLIADFPYSEPRYTPIKPLEYEYRKLLVKNYFVFYRIDETKKTVTVARVIYAKRNTASVETKDL